MPNKDWEELSPQMRSYYRRKFSLMWDILERNLPVKLNREEKEFWNGDEPFCQVCKKRFSEVREMHVEHPNNDNGTKRTENGRPPGGYQLLDKYEDHFEQGKSLWVVCSECHYLLHKRRDGKHHSRLQRSRPWLEELEDIDAEFEIRQRMKEGSIYG